MLRRPDVIEVSVRKEHAADKLLLSFEERDIGNEVIDAEHSLFRELEPEVDDEEIFIHLYNHAVSSDFFESPEGDDAYDGIAALLRHWFISVSSEHFVKRKMIESLTSVSCGVTFRP